MKSSFHPVPEQDHSRKYWLWGLAVAALCALLGFTLLFIQLAGMVVIAGYALWPLMSSFIVGEGGMLFLVALLMIGHWHAIDTDQR